MASIVKSGPVRSKLIPQAHDVQAKMGTLVTPKVDKPEFARGMRYELIPGAYFCSKKGTRVIHGLKLLNPPRALAELIEEVNRATPKQVFFFDSGFVLGADNPYAVNWTDNRSCPTIIPVFLNPNRAIPEIVAHELMHSWIEFYAGLEDGREYKDPSNQVVANAVNFIQSMVLDCTVLWKLRERGGFDLDVFRKDILADVKENVLPFKSGLMHATPFGQLVAAQALAVPKAVPDLYQLTKQDRLEVDELWQVCRKLEPAIASTADKITAALREHGYKTETGIRASIDQALSAAFEFLCVPYNPDTDMLPRTVKVVWVDKMPDYMPGLPLDIKHQALNDSIRTRQHVLWSEYTPGKKTIIRYAPPGLGYSPFFLPEIKRPRELGKPCHMFFFEPGTLQEEMDELQPPESTLPFPAADIYAQNYALPCRQSPDSKHLQQGGGSHVLLP